MLHAIAAAHGRTIALLATTFAAAAATPAVAASNGGAAPSRAAASSSASLIVAAQRALGVAADGIVGPQTRRALRRFQRRRGLPAEPITGARTLRALGVRTGRRLRTAGSAAAAPSPILQRIAACESGGNPRAISPDGRYRGKYQFSRATWRAVGGTGDPAKASEATQDRLAAKLLADQGTAPWPNCA